MESDSRQRPVLIFGIEENATVARAYLHRAGSEVAAFVVGKRYLPPGGSLDGTEVVAFEEITSRYPPESHDFLAPLSHRRMNRVRDAIFREIKALGYNMPSYVAPDVILHEGVTIGENCLILEENVIQPFASIGDNVVVWSGNHIGHHTSIGDHCFLTSHVVIGGRCQVGSHCFLGINAAVRDGVCLGQSSYIAMSASVIGDTEPWGFYSGSPARRRKSAEEIEL